MWDVVDQLKIENASITDELPSLQAQIEELERELKKTQLQNRALLVYSQYIDVDKTNAVGYKSIVVKLSGFAKFELDTKITKDQFHQLVDGMCRKQGEGEQELDEERYEQVCAIFEKAYRDGQAPFAGDLENETYKAILNRLRTFTPTV